MESKKGVATAKTAIGMSELKSYVVAYNQQDGTPGYDFKGDHKEIAKLLGDCIVEYMSSLDEVDIVVFAILLGKALDKASDKIGDKGEEACSTL